MKLNMGCGYKYVPGWVNIDIAVSPRAKTPPDILCDLRSVPLGDGVAEELMAIHVFEHFYEWEVDDLLREWARLMKPGALLTLEMPDILKAARNLLASSDPQLSLWGMYGDPSHRDPYMCHRWGWTFDTIKPRLKRAGFGAVTEEVTVWHAVGRGVRDFRVVAHRS